MRFFRGGSPERDAPPDFWAWWGDGRDRVGQAIATGTFDEALVGEIARAVQTVHPDMAWELAPGRTAQHAFCISPEGNAELRQLALRWLSSAPQSDAMWEYHASKQAAASLRGVEIGGLRLDLGEMRAIASWDTSRRRLDVRLWHPQFPQAPEGTRLQAGFVFLDTLLGEEDVERWIGEISLLEASTGGRTPGELKAEVERHRDEPAGDGTWILGTISRANGAPAIVAADAALKRIDHPFADHHVTISVLYGADRLPTERETAQLNDEEDDFLRRLGDAAIYAGRVTEAGLRTMHFVTENPDQMRPAIDGWAQELPDSLSEGLPQRRIRVNFEHDMDWSFQRDLGVR